MDLAGRRRTITCHASSPTISTCTPWKEIPPAQPQKDLHRIDASFNSSCVNRAHRNVFGVVRMLGCLEGQDRYSREYWSLKMKRRDLLALPFSGALLPGAETAATVERIYLIHLSHMDVGFTDHGSRELTGVLLVCFSKRTFGPVGPFWPFLALYVFVQICGNWPVLAQFWPDRLP